MSKLVIGSSKTNIVPAIVRDFSPAHYVEYTVDANGILKGGGSTIINMEGVSDIDRYGMTYTYTNNIAISGCVNWSSLLAITGYYACQSTFMNCTNLTSVDFSSLTTIGAGGTYYVCSNMFSGCIGLTNVDLSSLTTISGSSTCSNMFSGCNHITNIDLSSLTTVSGQQDCENMFQGCTSLTNVDLSSLITTSGNQACKNMFQACSNITTADLSLLTNASSYMSCGMMLRNCTALTSVDFSSLTSIGSQGFQEIFGYDINLSSVSFPSITLNSFIASNAFLNICTGVTNMTLHFPSNTQSAVEGLSSYPNFGGTNTIILFDLPATYTLTGADSVTYTRNPKYDTPTALAWKVGTYGTTNFTPVYYTNGVTDPEISNSIYSDAACTAAVTTISTIA